MNRSTWNIIILVVVAILVVTMLGSFVNAQEVVVVPEPLPEHIDTWGGMVAYYLPKILNGVLAIAGTIFLFSLRYVVALAPGFVQSYIDTKRQRDLHSAVMSKVAELIKEGRWPTQADVLQVGGNIAAALKPDVVDDIRDYVVKYNPQAAEWANVLTKNPIGDALIRTLAIRKSIELTGDPLTDALNLANPNVGAQPVPGVYNKPVDQL